MADQRSITARFTADTSGFSPKVNELIQHLKSLNSEYAANEQEIKRLNTEMKSYQKELQTLEQKQRSEQGVTNEEKARMSELRDSIARCAEGRGGDFHRLFFGYDRKRGGRRTGREHFAPRGQLPQRGGGTRGLRFG